MDDTTSLKAGLVGILAVIIFISLGLGIRALTNPRNESMPNLSASDREESPESIKEKTTCLTRTSSTDIRCAGFFVHQNMNMNISVQQSPLREQLHEDETEAHLPSVQSTVTTTPTP